MFHVRTVVENRERYCDVNYARFANYSSSITLIGYPLLLLNRREKLIQIDSDVYVGEILSRTTTAIFAISRRYADSDIDEVCTHYA